MTQSKSNKPLGLYLHIPFCRNRCSYCDFNTYTSVGELQSSYVDALQREIMQVASLAESAGHLRKVQTLFFGGGTPSLLSEKEVQRLLLAVDSAFGFTAESEVTLEANPETVSHDYLAAIGDTGINRISFGMQSANINELAMLGRTHDVNTVIHAVRQARAAGISNINLDLIYGLPAQSLQTWEQSLRTALELDPTHLSLYCLTIEQGTPMQRWLQNGKIQNPDPDIAADHYELACRILDQAGYRHYEISNWALPKYECRHNLAYWRDHEYLGLGAGAHGMANGYRYALVRQPRVYIRRINSGDLAVYPLSSAVAQAHALDKQEAMSDRVITQLRLLQEGLDLQSFKSHFGLSVDEAFNGVVGQLESWDLLRRDSGKLLLTERGWFISNQVFYRFI
jgi:oxygen-independent coproporphyrinogen-3 oxidase